MARRRLTQPILTQKPTKAGTFDTPASPFEAANGGGHLLETRSPFA
jgi:hypothetical protein